MKPYYPYIITAVLMIAAFVFIPRSCDREPTQNDILQQQAKTAEWQAKAAAAEYTVKGITETRDLLESKLFTARDSIRVLRKRAVHLYSTVATAEVRVDTVRDTLIHNVVQDVPVSSAAMAVARTGTIDDSTKLSWIDRVAVRWSLAGAELTFADVRFSTNDFQTQFTEKVAPGFWAALFTAVGLLAASLYFNFK